MSGRQQREAKIIFTVGESRRLAEGENVFLSLATDPHLHERRCWSSKDHLAMRGDMIAVRMADEHSLPARLCPARVQPQAKIRQVQAAGVELNAKP